MQRSPAMMMGSKMRMETDEHDGRAVGSKVRMHGKMMGIELALQEVVTQREPPNRKAWETVDANLLVIGQYRLGVELRPHAGVTKARIFIDYALPERAPARWLGRLFGPIYARWCTRRMATDAIRRFGGAD
jgi:hypothetical protein